MCVANLHASAGLPERAAAEVVRAAEHAVAWSGEDPLVFGGDLNLRPGRDPEPFERAARADAARRADGARTRSTICWRAGSR